MGTILWLDIIYIYRVQDGGGGGNLSFLWSQEFS